MGVSLKVRATGRSPLKRSVTVPKPLLSLSYRLSNLGTWSGVAGRQRLIQHTPLRKPVVRRIDQRTLLSE
jgi:hypothetical protein